MAWTYDQLIAEMHTRHTLAQSQLAQARTDITTAEGLANAEDYKGAILALADAVYHNNQAIEYALASSYYGYDGATNIIPTALDRNMACPFITEAPEYELTMTKLLETLWDAEPHQCLLFVPMIDAMRGSIQEKTVTSEWMSNALRHFM